jgi:large subunit ribosomal protein L14e
LINFGENVGKLAVIVNVIDSKRVLIDGPSTINGVPRQVMPLKRLSITNIKCKISPGARISTLVKAYAEAGVAKKWTEGSWAKGIAKRAAKAKLTDFDRFKVMVARKTVSVSLHAHTMCHNAHTKRVVGQGFDLGSTEQQNHFDFPHLSRIISRFHFSIDNFPIVCPLHF